MRHIFIILSVLVIGLAASAYEIDNFTNRYKPLGDSRDVLNAEINKRLEKASEDANGLANRAANYISKGADQCDKQDLYEEVHDQVGGWVVGSLERYADNLDSIQKHQEKNDGIYFRNGQRLAGSGLVLRIFGTTSSLNLNGNYVGVDKLGHFFDQGFEYLQEFKKGTNFSGGVQKALKYGRTLENGMYGTESTGIFSNADLVANYSGLQFWLALTDGPNPYFKCVQGRWKMARKFDFANYVNSGWDEAINCNRYLPSVTRTIEDNQIALEKKARKNGKNHRYLCPVSYDQCRKLAKQYKSYATDLLSYECRNAQGRDEPGVPYSSQVPQSSSGPSSSKNSNSTQKSKGAH